MKKEQVILLNRCLPFLQKRSANVISWIISEKVNIADASEAFEITTYLIEEDFAVLFDSEIVNILSQGKPPVSRTIILTDKGRSLKWCNSLRVFKVYYFFKMLSPYMIAFLALIVSILNYLYPQNSKELNEHVKTLELKQQVQTKKIEVVDSIASLQVQNKDSLEKLRKDIELLKHPKKIKQ